MSLDPVIHLSLSLGLAAVLLTAAAHKFRDRAGFLSTLAGYRLMPSALLPVMVWIVPTLETTVALTLVLLPDAQGPVLAASALWILYGGAIAINLIRGNVDLDCGCGGLSTEQRISWALVARNLVLVAATLTLLIPETARMLIWIDYLTILFGSVALAGLYALADLALQIQSRLFFEEVS